MYKQQLMVDSSNFNASLRSHELFRSKSEQLLLAQKKTTRSLPRQYC